MPVSKISTVGESSRKVDRLAEHVPEAAERLRPDGHRDRPAGVHDVEAAGEAVRRVHRDGAHAVVAQVLLHLGDEDAAVLALARGHLDLQRVVDLG